MADPKAPEKVTPIVIEGFEINAPNVTFQRLQEFSLTLYERLLLQRKERNFILLERDKLLTALTNIRHEIRAAEAAAVNKEVELERVQERHRQDVKEVDQEVKYLEYDHNMNLEQLRAWENSLMVRVQDENLEELLELQQEKRRLKEQEADNEVKIEEQLMSLKRQHTEELLNLQQENEETHIKKEMEFKRGLVEMKEEMTLRHEMEMSEVEERKNCHLMELRNIHKKRLDELKYFFNSVTAENLAVISCMKESLDVIEKNKISMANEMDVLKNTTGKLKISLKKSNAEVKELRRQLTNYEKDLLSLKVNKRMLKETSSKLQELKQKSFMAVQTLKKNETDISEYVHPSCIKSMVQFRNYAAAKRKQLGDFIEKMISELITKINTLEELLADPDVQQDISELNYEEWCPFQVTLEVATAKMAYDEALATLEEKLKEFCVPESILGCGPWKLQSAFGGPAGFVSKQ